MRIQKLLFVTLLAAGCGGGDYAGDEGGGWAAGPNGQGGSGQTPAGQLTAADWDDNLNFDVYTSYVTRSQMLLPKINTAGRVVIRVTDGAGQPLNDVGVTVERGAVKWVGSTGSDGQVLYLPAEDGIAPEGATVTLRRGEAVVQVAAPATASSRWNLTLPSTRSSAIKALDLAFVIDATGSMGDEIEYLKAEVQGIVARLRSERPDLSLRLGLVVYRDQGDAFVTRSFEMTADVAAFQKNLADQRADGGGDYPEAAEKGLAKMNELGWRDGDVARVAFFLADAPPHAENAGRFLAEAMVARERGVRIYPIAASGTAAEAELLMRGAALATLGRYIFLTDDSGIGNDHEEPHIPCYQVQLLKDVLLRALRSELAGHRIEAETGEIIRTVGNPVNGVCKSQG